MKTVHYLAALFSMGALVDTPQWVGCIALVSVVANSWAWLREIE